MDEDFLDLIDQAFLDGQIDGETMVLACIWLEVYLFRINDMNVDDVDDMIQLKLPS